MWRLLQSMPVISETKRDALARFNIQQMRRSAVVCVWGVVSGATAAGAGASTSSKQESRHWGTSQLQLVESSPPSLCVLGF
jgi:hypothetical protein